MNGLARIKTLLNCLLLIALSSSVTTACDIQGRPDIRISNPTAQDLVILQDGYILRTVKHNEETTVHRWPGALSSQKYLFEAKNREGDVFISEELTWDELEERDWTIIIPASPQLDLSNNTQRDIIVFIDGNLMGTFTRGAFRKELTKLAVPVNLRDSTVKYHIEALDKNLEVVFSQEFTYQELENMDWRIRITSPDAE
jgi:hypothetical protein